MPQSCSAPDAEARKIHRNPAPHPIQKRASARLEHDGTWSALHITQLSKPEPSSSVSRNGSLSSTETTSPSTRTKLRVQRRGVSGSRLSWHLCRAARAGGSVRYRSSRRER